MLALLQTWLVAQSSAILGKRMAIVIDDLSATFVDRHNPAKKGIGNRLPLLLKVKGRTNPDHLHVGPKKRQVMSPAAEIDLP